MPWIAVLLTITILILINALYVAAEFSTVSARRSRLAQIAAGGNPLARLLLPIVHDPRRLDTYIAACQLGITASSLLLGFYGQSQLTPRVAPLLAGFGGLGEAALLSLAATSVLILLTFLQVIMGELVPKSISIQYPERLALLTALPMKWSTILLRPLIWFFNGSGRLLMRLTGLEVETPHTHIHAPQEILLLFEESTAGGLLDPEERRLLKNSLEMRQTAVRQVMIPRNRMLASPAGQPCHELLSLLADSPFSRLPLYEQSVDNIVGFVHLKDLLCLSLQPGEQEVRAVMRSVLFVPETMPADRVFAQLQRQRLHLAIVLDEYGGTAGFVTLEDLIEEVFGELQDEFDLDTGPPVRLVAENRIQVRGDMLVDELNEALDLILPSAEVDTIGGLVLNSLGHVPKVGERVELEGVTIMVDAMDGKGVTSVSLEITPEQRALLDEWSQ